MIVGGDASVRAWIDGVGQAGCTLINAEQVDGVAIASTSLVNPATGATTIVIGADDSLIQEALGKKVLYGAYHNVLTKRGVSAVWNGVITNAADAAASTSNGVPQMVINGKTVTTLEPNNMSNRATRIVFFKKGAAKATISADDAAKRCDTSFDLLDESVF